MYEYLKCSHIICYAINLYIIGNLNKMDCCPGILLQLEKGHNCYKVLAKAI